MNYRKRKNIPLYKQYFYTILVLFVLYTYSCNSGPVSNTNDRANDGATIDLPKAVPIPDIEKKHIYAACKAWYDTILGAKGFNGGILIAKNGNIIFERYNGTGHLPGKDTITANTPFHIASVSKTFTAMAVLKLWQEGKLSLDDELVKYFPLFNYPGVTIRTLLDHRSGLPNYTYFMEKLGWDKTKFASNEDVLNTLINRKGELEDIAMPNSKFHYCNTNYALLALLIEKISGKPYSDFLRQTFFVPLQMTNTFVFSLKDTLKVNPSYDWKERLMPFNFLDAIYGDKNIYTTPRDLLIWDRLLSSGKIFTDETLQEAYAPHSNEKPGIKNYGLGWRMNIYPNGKKIVFHNGWWHGNNAVFIRLLQDSATIIVLGNKFNRAIYDAVQLANIFGDYLIEDEEENEGRVVNADTVPAVRTPANKRSKPLNKNNKLDLLNLSKIKKAA